MDACESCYEQGIMNCKYCALGNPCMGCADYDIENNTCTSKGACADTAMKLQGGENDSRRMVRER